MSSQPSLSAQFSSPESDPEVAAMVLAAKRAKRRPIVIALSAIATFAALMGLKFLQGWSAVTSQLQDAGYTDVHVNAKGLFQWGFRASKGSATCSGSVERIDLFVYTQSSHSEFCYDAKKGSGTTGSVNLP